MSIKSGGNADYQTQISLGQALFGLFVSGFDPLCQFRFLLTRQERYLAQNCVGR